MFMFKKCIKLELNNYFGLKSYSLYEKIVTRKELVWKWHNFFCLCYVPVLTSAQSFHKGKKSSEKF